MSPPRVTLLLSQSSKKSTITMGMFGRVVILPAVLALLSLLLARDSSALPERRELPEKILVGYSSICGDGAVPRAVSQGVNVVVWAFASFASEEDAAVTAETKTTSRRRNLSSNASPEIHTHLDLQCIRSQIEALDDEGFDDTVHLVSFGGWGGKHLDPKFSSKEFYESFLAFGGDIFHGIDWDFEGSDDSTSPTNQFSVEVLDRMGEFSRLAKEDGYIVSMVPPQSYLDFSTARFSRRVDFTRPYDTRNPDFHNMGRNVYAYLLAKYGESIDFVSVQLYESNSRAAYAMLNLGVPSQSYIENYVTDLALRSSSFWVDFEQDSDLKLESQLVGMPLDKLVIGLANGCADNTKTISIDPTSAQGAYENLDKANFAPRGFMFWTIDEEGRDSVTMAGGLNRALHTRSRLNGHMDDIKATS